MKIFIGLLAYNEEQKIEELLECISIVLRQLDAQSEIIVVDDGSRDNTPLILREWQKKLPIHVITHPVNLNVGAGFRSLIGHACQHATEDDFLFILESDLTSDPTLILQMTEVLNAGSDVVIASRYRQNGGYAGFPLLRLLLSRAANLLFQILFKNSDIRDFTIFYRGYRISILQKAIRLFGHDLIRASGFSANAELLFRLLDCGAQVREVPFCYNYSLKAGKSKLKILKTIREYAVLLRLLHQRPKNKGAFVTDSPKVTR